MLESQPEKNFCETMKARKHIESIHVLRGFAALLVVLEHIVGRAGYDGFNHYFGWLDNLGSSGVAIFFVISGFVLPFSLDNSYKVKNYPKFMLRRFVRIEPTYIASIIFSIVVVSAVTRLAPNATPWVPSASNLMAHLLYLIPFTGEDWIQGVYWTLAVEFQFYIIIGLLYPLIKQTYSSKKISIIVIPFVFSCFAFLYSFCEPVQLLKYSPYFALGLFLALHYRSRLSYPTVLLTLSMMTLPALVSGIPPIDWCVSLSTFFVILYWKPAPLSHSLLGRVALFGGTISYSWYVTHQMLASVGESAAKFIATKSFLPMLDLWVNLLPIAVFGCSVLVAWIFYFLIERPTQRLSRQITYKSKLAKTEISLS